MIPKEGGDSTPLGQRPLSVLPVVYRIWASARMQQLEGWFQSWVPSSVCSAGNGRSSVEACALDRRFLLVLLTLTFMPLLLMLLSPLIRLIGGSWIGF